MRKSMYFASVMAAFAITGCSKESVLDSEINNVSNEIKFTNSTYAGTRDIVEDTDGFNTQFGTDGFGVLAFSNNEGFDGPYIGNWEAGQATAEKVALEASVWNIFGPAYYWPTDAAETLDFLAYAPFGTANAAATKAGGLVITEFTPATATADQVDLMFAAANDENKTSSVNGQLSLNFQHALTAIQFTGKVTASNIFAKVANIEIVNVDSKGTFTLATGSETTGADADNSADNSDYVNEAGSWDTTYDQEGSYANAFSTTGNDEFGGAANMTTAYSFTDAANPFMLVPQVLTPWTAAAGSMTDGVPATGAYVALTLEMYVYDPADDTDGDGNFNETGEPAANKVYLIGTPAAPATVFIPLVSNINGEELWTANNRITYNITFDGAYSPEGPGPGTDPEETLWKITFDATAQPWDDVAGGDLDL